MEELLNMLIQKGWKPRNKEEVKRLNYHTLYREVVSLEFDNYNLGVSYSIRDLVSKESGLRQFCCKNKMVKEDDGHIARIINLYKSDESIVDGGWDYHYWLMICSILDESELEKFLLENIKIDGE